MTRTELSRSLAYQVPGRTAQEIEHLITNAVLVTPESLKNFFQKSLDIQSMPYLQNVEQRYIVHNGILFIGEDITTD